MIEQLLNLPIPAYFKHCFVFIQNGNLQEKKTHRLKPRGGVIISPNLVV